MSSGEEEEEEISPVPLGPNAFWTAMEPYLRAPTEQDLSCIQDHKCRIKIKLTISKDITPKPQRPDDPIFSIPPLGPHYTHVWASDDGVGKEEAVF